MSSREREQKLIDVCFDIALTISNRHGRDRSDQPYDMTEWSQDEKAKWIAEKLRGCGFDTRPMGCSWGVLVK